jgi:hypothetical protein
VTPTGFRIGLLDRGVRIGLSERRVVTVTHSLVGEYGGICQWLSLPVAELVKLGCRGQGRIHRREV